MTTSDHSAKLARFGVSMERNLLDGFDRLIAAKGYANRSEAIRDLVRGELVRRSWTNLKAKRVAVLALVYDHEHSDLLHRLTHVQHEHGDLIVSSLHVHLDCDNCLEVLTLKGPASRIERLAEQMLSIRGVKYGQLMRATTGKDL